MINEAGLDALMAQSTQQFNTLKVEEGTVRARLDQIDTGLKQLQGEYEAYNTLKKTLQEYAQADLPVEGEVVAGDPAALAPDPFRSKDAAKKEHAHASK
jgi:hypothetical protein